MGIIPTSEYFLDQDNPSFNHRRRFDMTVVNPLNLLDVRWSTMLWIMYMSLPNLI